MQLLAGLSVQSAAVSGWQLAKNLSTAEICNKNTNDRNLLVVALESIHIFIFVVLFDIIFPMMIINPLGRGGRLKAGQSVWSVRFNSTRIKGGVLGNW